MNSDELRNWFHKQQQVGKYWSSVGWVGLTPAVYGPEIFAPESP